MANGDWDIIFTDLPFLTELNVYKNISVFQTFKNFLNAISCQNK